MDDADLHDQYDHYASYDDDYGDQGDDVRCKRCGVEGLYWVHTGVRWRLMNGKGPHVCKPSADDFDVLN